jgi:hypothetical protein
VWKQVDKKGLVKLLETKSATLAYRGRNIDIGYGKLIDLPVINNNLKRFRGLSFAGTDPNDFNMWRGHAWRVFGPDEHVDMLVIDAFLKHVHDVICHGDDRLYNVEMAKNAWMYQHPNSHVKWATVLMGEEGAGKGTYTDVLCKLWGEAYSQCNINHIEQITEDKHRELISFRKLIVPNELRSLESKGTANFDILKFRITDDTYTMRNLLENEVAIQNVNNFIFSTNNYDSIQMGLRDRRYFALEVLEKFVGDTNYFALLQESLTDEFYEHLLNYFIAFDWAEIEEFNPFKPIETELKHDIKEMSMSLPEQFMEQFTWKRGDAKRGLTADALWFKFSEWCDRLALERADMGKSGVSFGMKIKRFVRTERKKVQGKTTLLYFPVQEEAPAAEDAEEIVTIEGEEEEVAEE